MCVASAWIFVPSRACPEPAVSHRRAAVVRGTNGVEGLMLPNLSTPISCAYSRICTNSSPIVVQYAGAKGATQYVVWAVGLVLIGVLAWAVMRSKVPVPEMKG